MSTPRPGTWRSATWPSGRTRTCDPSARFTSRRLLTGECGIARGVEGVPEGEPEGAGFAAEVDMEAGLCVVLAGFAAGFAGAGVGSGAFFVGWEASAVTDAPSSAPRSKREPAARNTFVIDFLLPAKWLAAYVRATRL